jgi:hypothetical protein
LTYVGKTGAEAQTLKVLSTGSGGLEGLKAQLTPDIAAYCLLRQTDQIDDSVTVKFAFINWIGDQVPRMQRARISVHLPIVKEFFGVCLIVRTHPPHLHYQYLFINHNHLSDLLSFLFFGSYQLIGLNFLL